MTEQKAVVPAEDSRLSFGQTSLRPQDFVPPRVKVVQQMSKEAQGGKSAIAQPGDLYSVLTGEVYEQPLKVQPIQTFMQRILLVRSNRREAINDQLATSGIDPLPEGDGLVCRSVDMVHGRGYPGIECDECPLSQWDEATRRPPLCTETYNIAAANELGELLLLSFSKSSAKVGKRFFSAIRMASANARPWTKFYEVFTSQQSNDQGTFFVPDFKVSPEKPDTGQLQQALYWAQQLQGVVIDVTPDEELADEGGDEKAPF